MWARPEVTDAVAHASPGLDRQIRRICAEAHPHARETRRAALSVARYARRLSGRPTPSGLFAGVVPAAFGAEPHSRWGSDHRAVARADGEWLAGVIHRVEGRPEALERLPVVANSTTFVRGDRLIVPYQLRPGERTGAMEVSMRNTAPVQLALRAARSPIRFGDLRKRLQSGFLTASSEKTGSLLTRLVAHRALITSLHAPGTEPDALGHLLEQLESAGTEAVAPVTGLREIHALLERHHRATAEESRRIRADAAARMSLLARTRRHPVALDLRLDAQVVLPREVAREAERAAMVLARLSGSPHGTRVWRDYHRRFYERFGTGALVPVLDVVADSGIGWPDGYPGTRMPEQRPERSRRDERLLALAQSAALDARREVVLEETLISDLEPREGGPVRLPPHLELCLRMNAPDLTAVRRGDFRLTVLSVSRAAGVVAGRLLSVLDGHGGERFAAQFTHLDADERDTVCAQLSFPPLDPATAHVTRAARTLPTVVSLAEYRDPTSADVLTVEDLAVGCDGQRLYLAAPGLGRRVDTWAMHALNLRTHTPPLARFLTELPRALCAQVSDFDWGAAAGLPFLPRLLYGRTVLAPARWRLDAAELPGRTVAWEAWDTALAEWRARRRLPPSVYLVDGDWRLPLDLDDAGHRVLLREHLNSKHLAVLKEASGEDAAGWCEGRAHEVVVPLTARQPPFRPALPRPALERVVSRDHGHTPGVSPVFLAQLHGDVQRQDTVLAEHLPALLSRWEDEHPVWWFLRFREGRDDCLRLRISLPAPGPETFGDAVGRVSGWADGLRRAGLLRGVTYSTSYPENGRWGSGEALSAVERVFAADSRTVLAQLSQSGRPDRRVLAAAQFLAVAVGFTGSAEAGTAWLIDRIPKTAPAQVPRSVFAEAVRLADPRDGFSALRRVPAGAVIVDAWAERARAIAAYRAHLPGPHTEGVDADAALDSLLHTHFLRAYGIDPEAKAACLYLARAAALAFTARTGGRP
ncbi:lantibiotic dehydratase [Streptomyces sp. NPDC004838]